MKTLAKVVLYTVMCLPGFAWVSSKVDTEAAGEAVKSAWEATPTGLLIPLGIVTGLVTYAVGAGATLGWLRRRGWKHYTDKPWEFMVVFWPVVLPVLVGLFGIIFPVAGWIHKEKSGGN